MRILFISLDPNSFRIVGELSHLLAIKLEKDEAGYQALPNIVAMLRGGTFEWCIFNGKAEVGPFINALFRQPIQCPELLAGQR